MNAVIMINLLLNYLLFNYINSTVTHFSLPHLMYNYIVKVCTVVYMISPGCLTTPAYCLYVIVYFIL